MGIWDSAQFSVKKSFEQNKYLPNQLIFPFSLVFTSMSHHIVVILMHCSLSQRDGANQLLGSKPTSLVFRSSLLQFHPWVSRGKARVQHQGGFERKAYFQRSSQALQPWRLCHCWACGCGSPGGPSLAPAALCDARQHFSLLPGSVHTPLGFRLSLFLHHDHLSCLSFPFRSEKCNVSEGCEPGEE